MRDARKQGATWSEKKAHAIRLGIIIFLIFGSKMLYALTLVHAIGLSPAAVAVYGQASNFTTNANNSGGVSVNSLASPVRTALDSNGNLYVADRGNNRILYYPAGSQTASRVYGQSGNFAMNISNNGGVSANSLYQPYGLALDSSGNLYVADQNNSRVLYYPVGSTTATRVYGQGGSFTSSNSNNNGLSATSLAQPLAQALDSRGNLYIADFTNNRVLKFQSSLSVSIQPPTSTAAKVNDTTQSGVGWHITITSTQFLTSRGSVLPTTANVISSVSAACTAGQICVLPTNGVSSYPLTVPAATTVPATITYFSAAAGTGTGDITITTTFSLTVPQGIAAGLYNSVITEALVKGQ